MKQHDVLSIVKRIAAVVGGQERKNAAQHGLSAAQLEALHYLARCNRYSDGPIGVADYLGATKGTVSQTLSTLVKKGLIEKVSDENDKRQSHCKLSASGKNVVVLTRVKLRGAETANDDLIALLRSLQVQNNMRIFGVCHTCAYFENKGRQSICGLTGERLRSEETQKICREHQVHS